MGEAAGDGVLEVVLLLLDGGGPGRGSGELVFDEDVLPVPIVVVADCHTTNRTQPARDQSR